MIIHQLEDYFSPQSDCPELFIHVSSSPFLLSPLVFKAFFHFNRSLSTYLISSPPASPSLQHVSSPPPFFVVVSLHFLLTSPPALTICSHVFHLWLCVYSTPSPSSCLPSTHHFYSHTVCPFTKRPVWHASHRAWQQAHVPEFHHQQRPLFFSLPTHLYKLKTLIRLRLECQVWHWANNSIFFPRQRTEIAGKGEGRSGWEKEKKKLTKLQRAGGGKKTD